MGNFNVKWFGYFFNEQLGNIFNFSTDKSSIMINFSSNPSDGPLNIPLKLIFGKICSYSRFLSHPILKDIRIVHYIINDVEWVQSYPSSTFVHVSNKEQIKEGYPIDSQQNFAANHRVNLPDPAPREYYDY